MSFNQCIKATFALGLLPFPIQINFSSRIVTECVNNAGEHLLLIVILHIGHFFYTDRISRFTCITIITRPNSPNSPDSPKYTYWLDSGQLKRGQVYRRSTRNLCFQSGNCTHDRFFYTDGKMCYMAVAAFIFYLLFICHFWLLLFFIYLLATFGCFYWP